jgi:3-hydroxyacyl-[acyl-carrier-protein] dehydratase
MHREIAFDIPAGHPAFAGHFPGRPILPGVLLLDAAVYHLLEASRAATPPQPGAIGLPCRINAAKFLSPVSPGESLTIGYASSPSGSTRFEILASHRKIAEGTLVPGPGA